MIQNNPDTITHVISVRGILAVIYREESPAWMSTTAPVKDAAQEFERDEQ